MSVAWKRFCAWGDASLRYLVPYILLSEDLALDGVRVRDDVRLEGMTGGQPHVGHSVVDQVVHRIVRGERSCDVEEAEVVVGHEDQRPEPRTLDDGIHCVGCMGRIQQVVKLAEFWVAQHARDAVVRGHKGRIQRLTIAAIDLGDSECCQCVHQPRAEGILAHADGRSATDGIVQCDSFRDTDRESKMLIGSLVVAHYYEPQH